MCVLLLVLSALQNGFFLNVISSQNKNIDDMVRAF